MKGGLYLRLAWQGIRKNRRLYIPFLLTGSVMVMMYYIVANLCYSPTLMQMAGGSVLSSILPFGNIVIAAFSMLFLLYTHSFLIRQRAAEFGLYNVLGMGKKHLARILIWETLLLAAATLVCGLGLGIVLSKVSELLLLHILRMPAGYDVTVSPAAIGQTAPLFAAIYAVLLLSALLRIARMNALGMLREGRVGEKPPKANWLVAVLGIVLLAAAYYLAVTIKTPMEALGIFFVAVLMVILATYMLFVSGSVALCRALQKNKRYYYKPSHFISVSSMVYRMRRTGAGLASICILSTMVLVTLSSTGSLYIGSEDALKARYPFDVQLRLRFENAEQLTPELIEQTDEILKDVPMSRRIALRVGEASGYFGKTGLILDMDDENLGMAGYDRVGNLCLVPLEDYNRAVNGNVELSSGECLLYSPRLDLSGMETFDIGGLKTLRIQRMLEDFPQYDGESMVMMFPTVTLVTPDYDALVETLTHIIVNERFQAVMPFYFLCFDTGLSEAENIALSTQVQERLNSLPFDGLRRVDCRDRERADYFATYGSLFFVGILLSIVFLFAAVLIIYYKQLSEGYEDQSRFAIMQKVGLTKPAIRKSVNSQMLTVFFLPLGLAGVHLGFAYPLVWKLLVAFGLTNLGLVLLVTVICYLIFCTFYVLVYKLTASAYYSIVSGGKA